MPCASAIVENVPMLSPDQEIGEVLDFFKTCYLDHLPVVDAEGLLLGHLSLHILLENLLPLSLNIKNVPLQGMDVKLKAAPGIAKRLKKIKPLKVSDLMERKLNTVYPDTPIWEGIAQMVEHGRAIMVIEKDTGKFLGMMNRRSALEELERMQKEEDE